MTKKKKKIKKFNLIDWLDENVFIRKYRIWYFLLFIALIYSNYSIEEHWLLKRGLSTTGVVYGYSLNKTTYIVQYKYMVPGVNKIMRGRGPDGTRKIGRETVPRKIEIGDSLKIVYDPKHPNRSRTWNFLYQPSCMRKE